MTSLLPAPDPKVTRHRYNPRHTRGDQALYEQRQLLLVFRKQVRHSSAEARRFCMRDDQPALHDAVGIQLALDADRVILGEEQICGEMQALISDVQDLAERGGAISRHETTPGIVGVGPSSVPPLFIERIDKREVRPSRHCLLRRL